MRKSSPIIDIVSQSGVSSFSYEIANSNSIPNPINPLGKKTDPSKKFKYRFSEDLPPQQLYRFQLAPEKNKKSPIQSIEQKIAANNGIIPDEVIDDDLDAIDRNLITTPSSLSTNFSAKTNKIMRKSINALENTHQNTSMPPSFHLEPEERLIKQRMPFLVLHGNPLQNYVIDYDEKIQSQRLNMSEKRSEKQSDIDTNNEGYFEDVPRVSYNDYVKLQNQIIDLQQQQRTRHFLPDHVPPYMRRKAQQSFSLSRPMSQTINRNSETSNNNNSIVQRSYQATSFSKSTPLSFSRPLDVPELNLNSKSQKRRAQTTKGGNRPIEYRYVINADFNDDDEDIQNTIISHNELVESLSRMTKKSYPPLTQANKKVKHSKYTIPNTPTNSVRNHH